MVEPHGENCSHGNPNIFGTRLFFCSEASCLSDHGSSEGQGQRKENEEEEE